MDDVTIAAALLHDAVEDTGLTLDEVEEQFGAEVAEIVDGVTKLERIQFDSKEAQQAATMRKMLVAMAKDIRVLVIKLADRLHNMRTIAALPHGQADRTARETLDIYAPLAHRLGMQEMKQQLEDLCFAALNPAHVRRDRPHGRGAHAAARGVHRGRARSRCASGCPQMGITAEVTGRPKHLWSIYEKMVAQGPGLRGDLRPGRGAGRGRVVQGLLRRPGNHPLLWAPVAGRFKDYIAMPKFNLYQSLHTTVIGSRGTGRSRSRSAPRRCTTGPSGAWPRTSPTRRATPRTWHG